MKLFFLKIKVINYKKGVAFIGLCLITSLITFQCAVAGVTSKTDHAKQIIVTGKVGDKNGRVLPGVIISEKGTTNEAVSNRNGNYLITASPSSTLVFTIQGYDTTEKPVNNKSVINADLKKDVKEQPEVPVGYGSVERSQVTGAISSISSKDLSNVPLPNVLEALRAQLPGVRITRDNGTPGSDVNILIRGVRSIDAIGASTDHDYGDVNAPLIVVDGIPYTGGNVSDIDPNDIDRIDILKDAAAASVYGSEAANGVILITTKNGTKGKPSVNVSFSDGFTDLTHKLVVYNGEEYTQMKIDALKATDGDLFPLKPETVLGPIELANYYAGKSIDWQDAVLRRGQVYQGNLSLTGGGDKIHYYAHGGLYRESGIVPYTGYNRYSFRVNADYSPFRFITIGVRTQLTQTSSDETGILHNYKNQPDFTSLIENSPLGEIYDSTGALVPRVNQYLEFNPFYKFAHSHTERDHYRVSVAPFLEFRILNGLSYKINGFARRSNEVYSLRLYDRYNLMYSGINTYEDSSNTRYDYLLDNILHYSHTFSEKHTISFTGVYGFRNLKEKDSLLYLQGYTNYYPVIYDLSNPIPDSVKSYSRIKENNFTHQAYIVGRLNYSYDNRYILTLLNRWDYSSEYTPDKKFGRSYSIAAAWNISNEKFLRNNDYVNDLKYRISWGKTGSRRGNDLHFQTGTSREFNTGLDWSIIKNRISGSMDYYRSRNSDDLYFKDITSTMSTGLAQAYTYKTYNYSKNGYDKPIDAETRNWGIDALLTGRIIDGDFKWQTSINWSKDVNKIVNFNKMPLYIISSKWFIGQDINEIYDYKFTGIVQYADTAQQKAMYANPFYKAGDPKIADVDGNDTLNLKDRTFQGSSVTPKWYGGITNTFSYKGFELSVRIEVVQGIKRENNFIDPQFGFGHNTIKENYWTPANQGGNFPQPGSIRSIDGYYYLSAMKIQNASYIAIRNVSLSYSLPTNWLKKNWIKSALIYIRGNNLKYFTKYQAYSPESKFGAYPVSKVWTAGLSVTF